MKTNIKIVLMVLILTSSIGVIAPSCTAFATEDVITYADKADTDNLQTIADSLVELNTRLQKLASFEEFRLAYNILDIPEDSRELGLFDTVEVWGKRTQMTRMSDTTSVWDQLNENTKNVTRGQMLYKVLNQLEADPLYTDKTGYYYYAFHDIMNSLVTRLNWYTTTSVRNKIKELMPELTGVDEMDLNGIVETIENLPNFEKLHNLKNMRSTVNAANNISDIIPAGLSAESLKSIFRYNGELMVRYNAIAKAALSIDNTVMDGLADWRIPEDLKHDQVQNPDQSQENNDAKPKAPNTGIAKIFEGGVLDSGEMTLIISATVAGVLGLGTIIKLYCKHNF